MPPARHVCSQEFAPFATIDLYNGFGAIYVTESGHTCQPELIHLETLGGATARLVRPLFDFTLSGPLRPAQGQQGGEER